MTLLLSANFGNWAAVQVTDKRLSQDVRTFDYANKQLLVRCNDAMFLAAFTGLAHLDGEPADDWIARSLLQTNATLTHNIGGPTLADLAFNEIYHRLRQAMMSPSIVRQTHSPRAGITVSMVGLRPIGPSRAVEPFWATFQLTKGQLNRWVSPKHDLVKRQTIKIDSFGSGAAEAKHYIDATLLKRGLTDAQDLEKYLVDVLRHVSTKTSSVGPDAAIASVNTDPTKPFDAAVRFVPAAGRTLSDVYTPWILAPHATQPPSATISGGAILGCQCCFRVRLPASGKAPDSNVVLSIAPGPRAGLQLPDPRPARSD